MAATSRRPGFFGWGIESTPGTAVTPTIWIPHLTNEPTDDINGIVDESVRANNAIVQGIYKGTASTKFAQSGHLFPDTFGHFLRALGFVDTVTAGAGGDAGKQVHTFALPTAAVQPPSVTIHNNDGLSSRQYPGCKLSELKVSVDVTGTATYSSSWVGFDGAPVSAATPSYTTTEAFVGANLTATVAAVATTKIQSAELTFSRAAEVVPGSNGTSSPAEIFCDGLDYNYSYKQTFDAIGDRDRYLAFTQHAHVFTLQRFTGATGYPERLVVSAPKAKHLTGPVATGDKYLTIALGGRGIYDATSSAPAGFVLINGLATAY